jgi:hyperosmotically inducible periplasmic protein
MYHFVSKIFVHKHSVASALLTGALFGMCREANAFGAPDDPSRNAMSLEFNSLDRNHNNKLSREEANRDADIGSRFSNADRNRDGALDAGEYANFKGAIQQARLEAYLEDSTITAKIKTELLKESGFQGLAISVETLHGKVILSGFVDNGQQRRRAVEIASGIRGVNQIKNSLQLKG